MYKFWTFLFFSTFLQNQTLGQPTASLYNYEATCFKSCPWFMGVMNENANKLQEYEQRIIENEAKIKRLEQLQDVVSELLEWKTKQDEERNGLTQSTTSVTTLATNQQQNTNIPETLVPKINFPDEGYKVYYVAFLKNFDNSISKNSLLISSKNATSVHIYSRQPSYDRTYSIEANGYKDVNNIPVQARVDLNATVTQRGILVNATDDVWVQGGNVQGGSLDGFNAIHIGPDSKEFLLIAFASFHNGVGCGFVVVGTQDNTIVKVFKPVIGQGRVLAVQTSLNKLDTYAWYASEHEDVSGFKVTSDKPIAVYAGHPNGKLGGSYEHMVSSIPPVAILGTDYIVSPVAGVPGTEGYVLKVVANEDNTDVTIFRQTVLFTKVLNEGEYFSWNITQSDVPLNVRCNKICIVNQFTIKNNNLRIDSYMMVIIPNCALSQNVRFGTLKDYLSRVYRNINLIIISVNQTNPSFQLDGKPFQPSWYPVPGRDEGFYFYSVTKIQSGFHHLTSTSTTGGFTAYVQGFNSLRGHDGFGYRLGLF